MHVPGTSMHQAELKTFEEALSEAPREEYDRGKWLYVPPYYTEYRYVLGTLGERPLLCVGLNPSTAAPGALDNTLKSVQRVATHNGYDSFLMMNLYAQRATRPRDMDADESGFLRRENLAAFRCLLGRTKDVWAAWGAVMETRGYLRDCVRDFVRQGRAEGARWLTAGRRSAKGHPHHPLYLKKDSPLEPFDAEGYLASWEG
ncbi:MAG: DUF1643 domain-containing protein [Clostridiales bacterium]|nr:DUF1643 domain-containing protein [Clostridiales bacterium]